MIKFEDANSEALVCACGSDKISDSEPILVAEVVESNCEDRHYICNNCRQVACVDFKWRYVNNINYDNKEVRS